MDWKWTLPFFEWAQNSWLGVWISSRTWPFAIIECFHLLGLTLLLGSVVVLSFRLTGIMMNDVPLREFGTTIRKWMFFGLLMTTASGICMFAAEAVNRCYSSSPFWWKMAFFGAACIFHFTLWRKVVSSDRSGPALRKLTAVLSLFLWFGVGFFGRAIGFL